MNRARDFKSFQGQLDQLCATYLEGRKASNALLEAYWYALEDVPIEEITANVRRLVAQAAKGAPLPKPRELRSRPALQDRNLPGIDMNLSGWEALKARDPVSFEVEFRLARAARELAGMSAIDPGYDEWTREYQRWAAVRYAPREVQDAALARIRARQGEFARELPEFGQVGR